MEILFLYYFYLVGKLYFTAIHSRYSFVLLGDLHNIFVVLIYVVIITPIILLVYTKETMYENKISTYWLLKNLGIIILIAIFSLFLSEFISIFLIDIRIYYIRLLFHDEIIGEGKFTLFVLTFLYTIPFVGALIHAGVEKLIIYLKQQEQNRNPIMEAFKGKKICQKCGLKVGYYERYCNHCGEEPEKIFNIFR